jgi:hypothetical protein
MAHDNKKGLVYLLTWAERERFERFMESYSSKMTEMITKLRYETNHFEEFLEDLFYHYD